MQKGNITEAMINEYTKIAYYYHKAGFTQEEIANKMNMSRQRVNRILAECISLGIVQIHVVNINENYMDIEAGLEKKFNLKGACVMNNLIKENIYVDLGMAAGRYIGNYINEGDTVGFSRGRATAAMVDYMPLLRKENLTVTQLLGSANHDREHVAVDDIVHNFAVKLQAKPVMLYAPVIVQSSELQNSIIKEPFFQEAYNTVRNCNVAIVGIGTASGQTEHLLPLNAIQETEDDKEKMERAVGEVGTHFFDAEGRPVIPSYRNRIIAISLEDYLNIPIRIGIAGLPEKADAIYAALKGGYINVLVTDLETAKILKQKP
jgi:deoxyribonucleoside regulator